MPPEGPELEQLADDALLQREWRAFTAGRVVMGLIVVFALLGGLGRGLLAQRTVSTPGGLHVAIDRVLRHASPAHIDLEVPLAAGQERAEVWFERELWRGVEVLDILPPPTAVRGSADRVTYAFTAEPGQTVLHVRLRVEPGELYLQRGRIGVGGEEGLTISTLVLP